MNRGMGHESKDKQRSFGSGLGTSGSGPSSNGGQGGVASASPATNYATPTIAQGANIISGASTEQTPFQTVAVPVVIDPASLLKNSADSGGGQYPQVPIVGTQKDAEARANKYLFEAQRDINEARDAEEILGHTRDEPFEPPHINPETSESQDQDNRDDGKAA